MSIKIHPSDDPRFGPAIIVKIDGPVITGQEAEDWIFGGVVPDAVKRKSAPTPGRPSMAEWGEQNDETPDHAKGPAQGVSDE